MTYEERVYAAAKTYADSYCSYSIYEYEMDYTKFYYEGRKAIEMQAEAIREFCIQTELTQEGFPVEQHLKQNGYIPDEKEDEQHNRRSNCAACAMLAKGVKFRKSPPHTCGK